MNPLSGTLFDLDGKVTLITGSTKGMGRDIARRFVQHGARVVISSRNQPECDAYAHELNQAAGREVAIGIAADLLDVPSLEKLVDRAVQHLGRLDNVIGNAAVLSFGREDQVPPDDFAACLVGNIRNNYLLSQRALPHLRQVGGGSIVFISSVGAFRADSTMAVYSIAKRGLLQMAENMALNLGPDHIRVNCIAPGFIRTEGTRPLWTHPQGELAGNKAAPLGRIGEGDDIAGAALYLCSAAGSYMTGQTLVVDGGMLTTGGLGQAVNAQEIFAAATIP